MMRNYYETVLGILILVVMAGPTLGQDANRGRRLEGSWNVVVTPRVCATGAPITTFQATYNYDKGGALSAVSAGTGSGGRGREQHGIWRHLSANNFRYRIRAYLFDAVGVATGYQILTHDLVMQDRDNYTSGGSSETFSLDGVPTASGCSTTIASREPEV